LKKFDTQTFFIRTSKKGHNSGTPAPNLTKQMSCTVTLYKVYVYQLSFRYVAAVLEHSRGYRLSTFDITERTMQTF